MSTRTFFLASVLLWTSVYSIGVFAQVKGQFPAKAIKDLKSGIIYYEESDRRHIAAIGGDGKVIWCCEVFAPTEENFPFITDFGIVGDKLWVSAFVGGMTTGAIDIKTGVFTGSGRVQ